MSNSTIVKIDLSDKTYGGRIYEKEFVRLLDGELDIRQVYLLQHRVKILNLPRIAYLYLKYRFFYRGPLVLTNHTTWLTGRNAKNMVIVHHVDTSTSSGLSGLFQKMCDKALLSHRHKYLMVVTVAEYWRKRLQDSGFDNVRLIYNSFDPELYRFSDDEIADFKKRYDLNDKPIIYLGNCQKQKGVVDAYAALASLDAHFVTSGIKDVEIPARHLNLNFRDYRLLLASSSLVVTMSRLTEGWNRTAHEAMLCGTPVIGSATGGMLELFKIGGGIVCKNYDNLKALAQKALEQPNKAVADDLKALNLDYFKNSWRQVLDELIKADDES